MTMKINSATGQPVPMSAKERNDAQLAAMRLKTAERQQAAKDRKQARDDERAEREKAKLQTRK
jgi:hypothetical protein